MIREEQLILDEGQVLQKLRRIAFEIYENNFHEKNLLIAGIYDNGYFFAKLLAEELSAISHFQIKLVKVEIDKKSPEGKEIKLDCEAKIFKNQSVILADDVLNTGRTLAYSLRSLLNNGVKKLEIAVLVNRKHSLFPISATYTGYELATTIKEHVEVRLNEKEKTVYLLE